MAMARQPSHREAILEAAVRVLLRDGLLAMTLEAVAREANVSKGGVFYHFASKDDLVSAMVTFFLEEMKSEIATHSAADPEPKGRFMRAYFKASFAPTSGKSGLEPSQQSRVFLSLLAAAAMNPSLLEPLRAAMQEWRREIEADEPASLEPILLWLAADGLWFWQLLGMLQPGDKLHRQLQAEFARRIGTKPQRPRRKNHA